MAKALSRRRSLLGTLVASERHNRRFDLNSKMSMIMFCFSAALGCKAGCDQQGIDVFAFASLRQFAARGPPAMRWPASDTELSSFTRSRRRHL